MPSDSSDEGCPRRRTSTEYSQSLAAIDLFSGCGGLTAGLIMADFRVLAAVEISAPAVTTYRANHPETTIWHGDIRDLRPTALMQTLGLESEELDLLAGCPPCQGFSILRTRNGSLRIEDSRNNLIHEFLRLTEAFLPRAVMLENVPGLARDERFVAFCQRMEGLGYVGSHRILDAADYGVPQRRHRLIYIAGLGQPIPFARREHKRRVVRDAIFGLPPAGSSGDPPHDIPERRSSRIMEVIRAIPRDGGSRSDLPTDLQLACHRRCNGFSDVYGRLSWNKVAPTLTTGCFNPSKGRFLHPTADRAITMREAALLQGFPPSYLFDASLGKEALAALIGNALPPPFVAAHSRSVSRALGQRHR